MYTKLLFILLLATAISLRAKKPNWVGTFKASHCIKKTCCCLTGNVVTQNGSFGTLKVQVSLDPKTCLNLASETVSVPYPTGFSTGANLFGLKLSATLSPNSNQITGSSSPAVLCPQTFKRKQWGGENHLSKLEIIRRWRRNSKLMWLTCEILFSSLQSILSFLSLSRINWSNPTIGFSSGRHRVHHPHH